MALHSLIVLMCR